MGNTHIGNIVSENNYRLRYDAAVKRALSDKQVLAMILKYTVKEFDQCTKEEIMAYIEGTPEVAVHRVRPGLFPEEVSGITGDSKIPGEGEITYDIIFYALTPDKERVKIIVDVEAQKNCYPGYNLINRATFYCARMLSEQLDKEFTTKTYNNIKKVYSIWICMDAPKCAEYSIAKYHMEKENFYGTPPENGNYDLMEIVMIYLGREERSAKGNRLHQMLSVLLSETLSVQEKKNALDSYDIQTRDEMEGGLESMCNLSELIADRAEERGLQQGLSQGLSQGLRSTIHAAATFTLDINLIHAAVIKNKPYKDVTLEQVKAILEEK